jgi:hypothetical protein
MEKEADFVKNWEECIYCGSHESIQSEHVIAQSKGGKTVVPACKECNCSKNNKQLMVWLRWVKKNDLRKWEKICEHNKRKRNPIAKKVRTVRDEKSKKCK